MHREAGLPAPPLQATHNPSMPNQSPRAAAPCLMASWLRRAADVAAHKQEAAITISIQMAREMADAIERRYQG